MNKDALLATIIGFVVGLCITGLILVGPKLISWLPKITLPTITLPTRDATPLATPPDQEFSVTIDSPLESSIESSLDLLVSGTTQAGSTVFIQTDADDAIIIAGDDGKYAEKITLAEGKNDITVTAYLDQKQMSVKRTVFYTPEEF